MPKIYIGLAQWHHSKWYLNSGSSDQSLVQYSHSFSSVEGNTSFYATPSVQTLNSWSQAVPDDFKFNFKFPKEISHKQCLTHCSRQVSEFLNRISVLNEKLGVVWLQLDHHFDRNKLPLLERFITNLPRNFSYGVEVRSLDYFYKDEIEQRFNQLLMEYEVNRVIFDTRSLFANDQLKDSATLEAFKAKPKVPTHVIATGRCPMARIIVPMDIELGVETLRQWATKVAGWLSEGRTPYLFFHTADNAQAPDVAVLFSEMLQRLCGDCVTVSLWNQQAPQSSLF